MSSRNWMLSGLVFFMALPIVAGQKYYTKTGRVTFVSQAPLEKIESSNTNALMVVDAATGNIECSVLIKGFQFDKALMQDHFNENYMESHKYPKGLFKGTILNIKDIQFKKDGTYTATIKGELTLHGVTKSVSTTAKLMVKSGNVAATTSFDISVSDFSIVIPKVVSDKVAEKVSISVNADLQLMP
jgi:polyisoprenoid-binding protein YceI